MYDGSIVIGTELKTDKFDKQIAELDKKIQKKETKKIEIETQITQQEQELQKARDEADKLAEAYQRVNQVHQKVRAKTATPLEHMQYQELTSKFGYPMSIDIQFQDAITQQEKLEAEIEKTKQQYAEINGEVEEYKQKIETIKFQKHNEEINQFKNSLNQAGNSAKNIGSTIGDMIKKVGKLALGVFGVRSAFMFLRRASSEYANYNTQYSANLEYIRYALTQMIAPVLEYIVNLARTVLAYINYIAYAWFRVNLFSNASVESFKKVKNNIGGANKQAKELQKTLLGFDEMNILNSNSTGGGGGVGGGGIETPDFDLSNLEDIEIPDWIKWIADNKEMIINAIKGIAIAFLVFKTLQITGILQGIVTAFKNIISTVGLLRGALLAVGLVAIFAGIALAIKGVVDFIKDPSWSNFKTILYGLEIAIAGLAVVMIAFNATNPVGWIILAVDAIALLCTVVADLIIGENEQIDTEAVLRQAEEDLKKTREELTSVTNNYIDAVEGAEDAEKKLKDAQTETGISIDELLTYMEEQNLTYKDLNENQRKVYKAYIDNKDAQSKLQTETNELNDIKEKEAVLLYEIISALTLSTDNYEDYKKRVVETYEEGKISAEDASIAIMYAMRDMDKETRDAFTKDLPESIKNGLSPAKYNNWAKTFNGWWNNNFIGKLNTEIKLNVKLGKVLQGFKNSLFATGGLVTKMATGGIIKMASGSIINMPNKGVPVATAVGGEAGAEGIIPLTDAQAMATLGREIGKNVLINLTNVTSMNGRIISRELKQVQNEQDFAYNM